MILHKSVLDYLFLFYPLLIPFSPTVIHAVVAVDVASSMSPIGPLPNSLF